MQPCGQSLPYERDLTIALMTKAPQFVNGAVLAITGVTHPSSDSGFATGPMGAALPVLPR